MSPQLVDAYGLVVEFQEDIHHMYIKAKKDPREEWVQMKYKIAEEDIQLIMQDWEPDWKVPTQGDMTTQLGNTEATQRIDVDMKPLDNGEEDTNQGNQMEDVPETKPTDQPPKPPPKTRNK
jgi:hypothetical protein